MLKPSSFERHSGKGKFRFLTRQRNGQIEVYGLNLDHLCWARDSETATMIAEALELMADIEEGFINKNLLGESYEK